MRNESKESFFAVTLSIVILAIFGVITLFFKDLWILGVVEIGVACFLFLFHTIIIRNTTALFQSLLTTSVFTQKPQQKTV